MDQIKSRQKIDLALTSLLLVLAVVILVVIFRQNTRSEMSDLYHYQDAQKDSAIATRDKIIENLRGAILRRDTSLSYLLHRLDDIQKEIVAIRNSKTIIIRDYENISPTVRNYSENEFWRRFLDTSSYNR